MVPFGTAKNSIIDEMDDVFRVRMPKSRAVHGRVLDLKAE